MNETNGAIVPNGNGYTEASGRENGLHAKFERVDATLVEIGLKGSGKLCEVALLPPSMILPSACVLGQVFFFSSPL